MKVWITQYALTTGIIEAEAEPCEWADMIVRLTDEKYHWHPYVHSPHWHTSHEDAIARAEKMRADKIASLEKQLARLKALTFGGETP